MAFNEFMHDRNIYKERPDFKQIALDYPELRKYAIPNDRGKIHVDFTTPDALRTVTKILLKKDFNLIVEIPSGFLIPTVPQRLNYILWIEDLLNAFPKENKNISGIDIGTGPCAIFSLLGAQKNAWKFLSTDTSDEAIDWAEKNIKANNLESKIKVVKVSKDSVLNEVLSSNSDNYDFCLCNPPFFDNIEEIRRKHPRVKETLPEITKENEILFEGGEVAFVRRMIEDSLIYKDRISLYTSMFGKKKSFFQILNELESMNDIIYSKTEFCQGNTVRWGIAWTFLKGIKFIELEKPKPEKRLKAKPPLTLRVPINKKTAPCTLKILSQKIQDILSEFEIQFRFLKSYDNFAEIQITTDKNTWSHQRRKRRKLMQDKIKNLESNSIVAGDVLESSSSNLAFKKIETGPFQSVGKITDEVGLTSSTNSDKAIVDPQFLHMPGTTECPSSNIEDSVNKEDSIDKNKAVSSHGLDSVSNENSKKRKLEDSMESCKKVKLDLNTSSNSTKRDSKCNTENDSFQHGLILYCCLKLIKCKNHVSVEMNCPPNANRETMHQVFQLLKNKLI